MRYTESSRDLARYPRCILTIVFISAGQHLSTLFLDCVLALVAHGWHVDCVHECSPISVKRQR